jgi:hypothetical protein
MAPVMQMSDGLEKILGPNRVHFKSGGERLIGNFLDNHKIRYQYEPAILVSDLHDKQRLWYLDFKLPEYAAFIEYFGMAGKPSYDEGIKAKMAVYKKMEMDVIPIYPSTLKGDWQQHIMEELDAINLKRYHSLQFNKYWSRKDQGGYRKSQADRNRHYGSDQLSLFQKEGYR